MFSHRKATRSAKAAGWSKSSPRIELSDGLCMLAAAAAFAVHAPLANTERSVIHARRPIILNGIDEFAARGDLGDRSLRSIIFDRNRESRLFTMTKTNRPKTEASSFVTSSGIWSCFDERIDGEKTRRDVTRIPATG